MTAEILCGAMHDNVRPILEWVLKIGAHESIVDNKKGAGPLADPADLSNVNDPH